MTSRLAAIMADHDRGPEYAMVKCTTCGETERIERSATLTDEELAQQFESMGWSVLPTLCPAHRERFVR